MYLNNDKGTSSGDLDINVNSTNSNVVISNGNLTLSNGLVNSYSGYKVNGTDIIQYILHYLEQIHLQEQITTPIYQHHHKYLQQVLN